MTDAVTNQFIVFLAFTCFFIVVLCEKKLKAHKELMKFLEILGIVAMIAVTLIFYYQTASSDQPVLRRVSEGGVHSINMVFFCFAFFIFYLVPYRDIFRGSILTLYLITLHEGLWNIFYYGIIQQSLVFYFLVYSSPTIAIMLFTLVVSIKNYKNYIKISSLITLASGTIYGLIWLSMGFPITVGTFENPTLTKYFSDRFVNMIEIGYVINFISTFLSTYVVYNRQVKFIWNDYKGFEK